ncbi:MAG: hypothetical protein ABEK16_03025 [Candidatus Nanohalobium sp.]
MRKIQKYRYVLAAVLTLTVFTMGMLFSNLMDTQRYQQLQNEMQENNVEMESRQLQLSYLKSPEVESCAALQAGLSDIVKGYNSRLEKVQQYQENSFFKEQQFKIIKRKYILSGIRYWMYAQNLRSKCDYNATTVLFFTRNLFGDEKCRKCSSVGVELTLLKKRYDGELLVFTIPTKLDDGAVNILEQQYNVTSTPALVVNGEKKIEGYRSAGRLSELMNLSETGR